MAAPTEIVASVVPNVTSPIIGLLIQHLKDVMELGKNLELLDAEFARIDTSLRHIDTQFEAQQKKLPELVETCLERIKDALGEVTALIHRTNRHRGRCLGCCLFCHPKIPAEIREWKTRFVELFQQLQSALTIAATTQHAVESAEPHAEVLLQPLPESGFVGSGVAESAQKVFTWLNEPHSKARVIGVYGMAGVGKTSLLQVIHNEYKKVSGNFDNVIWFTVSQNYNIERLQDTIAESVGLNIKGISSIETRKMKLYASLENKRFLLILDDVWSPIVDLNQVGVNFGRENRSRVLISSRSKDLVETIAENKYCLMIRPLSPDEGWELFRRRAFTNGAVRDNNLVEAIAREVASECKGLPLAINTVSATMARKTTADEWSRALVLMKNVDPSFPSTHRTIDADLYQRLRLSYDDLPDNLKMCFLYCAAFGEDSEIWVETLVERWTAESLILQRGTTYFMDVGQEYIDTLVDRCLVEYVDEGKEAIKVHDVLRDMAIYIGQVEENWLFLAGQRLQSFPAEEEIMDRKRISVVDNEISDLPADLKCPTLVSLLLARNQELKEIPERFLGYFMFLKVLDLSFTPIQALPASVGQLGQLEFLNLRSCYMLKDLPDSICNLLHLQVLNLENCQSLNSLPDRIGELKNLKHIHLDSCGRLNALPDSIGELKNLKQLKYWCNVHCDEGLKVNPHQISRLTSLIKLFLYPSSTPISVEDLTNLSNLIELDVEVKPEIKESSRSTWSEMRNLTLRFCRSEDENRDDTALHILPQNMQSMKKLQSLRLYKYPAVSLPNYICEFQNLKSMFLGLCSKLKELPALEIGRDAASGGFPMLTRLELFSLDSLESIAWNEGTMSKLQNLEIATCTVLETFRTEHLPNLRYVRISHCDKLKELFIPNGGFPMLEELNLEHLPSLESVAVPSSVWGEETMPKLQKLYISSCFLLRRLSMEKLPIVKDIRIYDCPELEVEIVNCFPLLETLILNGLRRFECIAWSEETMPELQKLDISACFLLRRLSMEKLPNVKDVAIYDCPVLESIAWSEETIPKLQELNINNCSLLRMLSMEKLLNVKEMEISHCPELELEIGNCFPLLETLKLHDLPRLESIAWSEETMPKLQNLYVKNCSLLRRLSMEKLPNVKEIEISHCPELELEIGNCSPLLETLKLHDIPMLESIVWSEETMPKLQVLNIKYCLLLRKLLVEKLPNVKEIEISHILELMELEIGNLLMLQTLTLEGLEKLESIASLWNEKTMPKLQSLKIIDCPLLRRLPMEMDKLPYLKEIVGKLDWWENIIWEDENVKTKLSLFLGKRKISHSKMRLNLMAEVSSSPLLSLLDRLLLSLR